MARPSKAIPRRRWPHEHHHCHGESCSCPGCSECTAVARGCSSTAAPVAPTPHPRPRPRGRGHREGPTVGTGGSAAGPVRRRSRRAGTLRAGHPPRRGRFPHRQNLGRLEGGGVLDPGTDPTSLAHPGRSCSRLWVSRPPKRVCGWRGSPWKTSGCCCAAISSNLHPAAFDELMPKTLATATVDRLLHHAHICQTTGESVRLSQALAGQGVSPLS